MTVDSPVNPLISVIIPVYNGENYLNQAISSVLSQSYKNYEIIVVDDGSTDRTWDIIKSYGTLIKGYHKENGGVSTALNYGISKMCGEWFSWLSHDDLWVSDKLEKQVIWMKQHPGYMIYYSGHSYFNNQGIVPSRTHYGSWYPKGKDLRHLVSVRCYISCLTILVHKTCFSKVGLFDEQLRCCQDLDFLYRILSEYAASCLPEPLAKSRIHESQVTFRCSDKCFEENKLWKLRVLSETRLDMFYPELAAVNICHLKRIILKMRASFFVWNTSIHVSHNIKPISALLPKIISKCPYCVQNILIKCYHLLIRNQAINSK